MLKKINISDSGQLNQEDRIDFREMEVNSYVDVSEDIQAPPVALSCGTYTMGQTVYPIRFGTYGNYSAIKGASKARKSFLKSLLIASYVGGSYDYGNFTTHRDETKELYVIDIDTEQGDWDAQWGFKRVAQMVGGVYPYYRGYALRKYNYKERLQFIEWLIDDYYQGRIGFMCIDGVADLVNDVNDLKQANELQDKILKWTAEGKFHLLTIIHTNFDSKKPTGHLGSAILKKAETICHITKNDNVSDVNFEYTRGYSPQDFSFEVKNGLPVLLDENGERSSIFGL